MSKAMLQGSDAAYEDLMNNAYSAERAGRFTEAVRHAVSAWVYVEDMMKYKRRWEQAEFKSVPCIDLVLKYAPLLLDNQCLNRLEELLRERRSIDKHASDDLASRLAEARANLRTAHRLWDHLEKSPDTPMQSLRQDLGGDQDRWVWLIGRWQEMGLIVVCKTANGASIRLTTCMTYSARAKCPACGAIANGKKRAFLDSRPCPKCAQEVEFAILASGSDAQVETKA